MPLVDVFMTTKNRGELLNQTLHSFFENTDPALYRFTLVRDGNYSTTQFANTFGTCVDYVLSSFENEGLGPSVNRALAHIDATNRYDEASGPLRPVADSVSQFVCYIQDDLLFSPKWLETLIKRFMLYEKSHNIGFASGLECVEHKTQMVLADGSLLKPWIRAACMFSRRSYMHSMWPIPRFDPETQRERAKPNDGIGSGVDWHFVRNHENSVVKTGKTCLVVPGLVVHNGFDQSCWLKRDLPESDEDKKRIEEARR